MNEYRVEFNLSMQGHYILANSCVEAINIVAKDMGAPLVPKPYSSARNYPAFVHCEVWKKDNVRVDKVSVFKDVKAPDWW